MALKSTIYKAELQIADMDRHYYGDHSLTVARHPSETDERMMVRLAAFAFFASERLELALTHQGQACMGPLYKGSYPVHKGHAVHKCTKRNLAVHFPSNGRRKRGVFHKTDSASYGGCGRVHLHIYDGRWMGDGRPGFVLCICARRGPCALDTIPLSK